jgi:hypothetical protein
LVLGNLGRATLTHPQQVIPHTVTGLAEIIAGVPAGVAGLTLHPSRLGQLPAAIGQDFSRRYGPLAHGDQAGFRQRLQQEGVAPELLDITALGGSVAAGGGRAVGALARAGHLGERVADFAGAPRPTLRISGNLTREQELSPNILRAGVQRAEDRARGRVLARRNRGELRRGIQPRRPEGPTTAKGTPAQGGEVVPIFSNRAQRVATSKLSARSYVRNRQEQMAEIGKGIERDLAGLSKTEQRAVFHVTSGLIPIHGTADDIRAAVRARRAQIVEHRVAHDVPDDPEVLKPSRELGALDFIDKHADELAGSQALKDFHARTLDRSRRLAELDPGLRNETARRQPYRVQGEALGVSYDPGELTGDARRAYDEDYIKHVQAAAQKAGLPEPVYFRHQAHPVLSSADRTAGNISRAIVGPKESELKLFREGRVYTGPDVLTSGLAKNIKRRHQWNAVADTVDAHAMPWSRKPSGQGRKLLDALSARSPLVG